MHILKHDPIYSLRDTPYRAKVSKAPVRSKNRKILGAIATASLTDHTTEISKFAAEYRITHAISTFFCDAIVRQDLKTTMQREKTDAQGASSSNTGQSERNASRHCAPVSTVSVDLSSPIKRISKRIIEKNQLTPKSAKELRALKIDTPLRKAIAKSPYRADQLAKGKMKDIFQNTHYGDQKHVTTSSLVICNEIDSHIEHRIRPFWDKLVSKQSVEHTEAVELTIEYVEKFKEILTGLKQHADRLENDLHAFFQAEESIYQLDIQGITAATSEVYLQHLELLAEKKKEICTYFSTCHEIASIKNRRIDWWLVKKAIKQKSLETISFRSPDLKDPEYANTKKSILQTAKNLQLEVSYQHETIQQIDRISIENLKSILFKDHSEEELHESVIGMLSPQRKRVHPDSSGSSLARTLDF